MNYLLRAILWPWRSRPTPASDAARILAAVKPTSDRELKLARTRDLCRCIGKPIPDVLNGGK